jgi:hypothetical protein
MAAVVAEYLGVDVLGGSVLHKRSTPRNNHSYHGIWLMTAVTLDHIEPLAKHHDDSDENLVTCCWSCNFGKDHLCRAEHLRPLAPGGEKWMSLYGRRNSAESLNSFITGGLLKGERARSNEPSRVWLDALRLVYRKNYRAYMVFCRRRGVDPGPPLAA